MYATSTAEYTLGWRTLKPAPIPCSPLLHQSTTHFLTAFVYDTAQNVSAQKGDFTTAVAAGKRGNNELDLATSRVVEFIGSLKG
jgi:hypothetical protein